MKTGHIKTNKTENTSTIVMEKSILVTPKILVLILTATRCCHLLNFLDVPVANITLAH